MKLQISFKDPDALIECINDALEDLKIEGVNDEELETIKEKRAEEYQEICSKWFEYGEYLRVEVDTDNKTCVVLEVQ